MPKHEIESNMIGKRARITLGMTDEEIEKQIQYMKDMKIFQNKDGLLSRLGTYGNICAVYLDGEKKPTVLMEVEEEDARKLIKAGYEWITIIPAHTYEKEADK